jgi:phenylalanyl-tRNA synthetase beta chain
VYWYRPEGGGPRERAAETAGTGRFESWELGIGLAGTADVSDLKGVVDALHDALGAPRPAYVAEEPAELHPHRHPGRSARIVDGAGRAYGSLGEVHPRVAAAWGIGGRPVDATMAVNRLLGMIPEGARSRPVPSVQPIDRDLAIVLDEATPVGELLRVARTSAGPLLADIRLFDVYRGEQVGAGRVSYAIAFRFQPNEAGDERAIDKALNRVRGAVRHHLGAEVR